VLAAAIGAFIVCGYVLALWWLLRRETAWTFAALAALCGVSLSLRVVLTTDYPAGFNVDEPKNLACSIKALQRGTLFEESCNGPPYLLSTVFAAPLVPYVGDGRWAMRTYALVTGVLATPAAFAAARALGLAVGPSLVAAGLVAVLPWSIFYGRITLGGELIFHQLLLLAGLARLVWARGSWADALLGGFGLSLLLWDYYAGRAMMGMPLVAAVLACGWRRAWCLAVIPIALIGWYPHLATQPPYAKIGFSLANFHPGFAEAPWDTLVLRTQWALWTFVWPVAEDRIFTVRAAAVHPVFLLVLAGIGVLTGVRRGLFLLAGFAAGILPGIVSDSLGISAHRIMMAYAFIALAAASAFNIVPGRWLRAAAVTAILLTAGFWSVRFYFSPAFWGPESRVTFDAERAALSEAVAQDPPARLIAMHQIDDYVRQSREGRTVEQLTANNWLPPDQQNVTYLFTWQGGPLRAQYDQVLPGRVRPVGKASFLVSFEAADWSWLRRYGWVYEARCGDTTQVVRVPFLYSVLLPVDGLRRGTGTTHVWSAHWHGPATDMTLKFTGRVLIEARGLSVQKEGFEQGLPFRMPADSDVTVTEVMPPPDPLAWAVLLEESAGGSRVPAWESFTPVEPTQAVNAEPAPPAQ
jgi:hypothetical protein